jgi:hypothetical protein
LIIPQNAYAHTFLGGFMKRKLYLFFIAVALLFLIGCSLSNGDDPTNSEEPDINIIALNTDFGAVLFGLMSELDFSIVNQGAGVLIISDIVIYGNDADDFQILAGYDENIDPNESIDVVLRFSPQNRQEGRRNALVTVSSNDPDESRIEFAITGEVHTYVRPEIHVRQGDTDYISGDRYDFGNVVADGIDGVTSEVVFTIENRGTGGLQITDVTVSGTNLNNQYRIGSMPAGQVLPGESTTFSVIFDPASSIPLQARVDIQNSDSDESRYRIILAGRGVN